MREFTTAAREHAAAAIDGAGPLQFTLDGEEFVINPPTPGQVAIIMAEQSGDTGRQIASVIDFLDAILDEAGKRRFRDRLLDRDDPFDLEQVQEIIEWAMDEWSSRPTTSSKGSSSSRARTGT